MTKVTIDRELLERIDESAICDGTDATISDDLFTQLVAALDAPVQGESVAGFDYSIKTYTANTTTPQPSAVPAGWKLVPDGWKLVPIKPTEAMLKAGDGYIGTPATYKAMLSAAPNAVTTEFSQFLKAVMDAAGLVRHGRQSKELSEYLGSQCMKYRLAAPSAPPPVQGVNQQLLEALTDSLELMETLCAVEGDTIRKARAAIAAAREGGKV